jgi:hypothetical protein
MKDFNGSIERCKEKYNNFYDYSEAEEPRLSIEKIKIICPVHGEFWQSINNHLIKGEGCPVCANEKKKELKYTNDEFLDKIRPINNGRYDLSKVQYAGWTNKITVRCEKHGEFKINACDFVIGKGCPKCSAERASASKRISNEDALSKAMSSKHGNDVTFERFRYNGRHEKSIFTCPTHGDFLMEYGAFCSGQGCPKCGIESRKNARKIPQTLVEGRIKEKHPDYLMNRFVYSGMDKKSIFGCPVHGDFSMTPAHLLNGENCPECAKIERIKKETSNISDVISKFNELFDNRYDYSKFSYKNAHNKSTVICPVHGEFSIDAFHHLRGQGCPICSSSHLEREIMKLLKENDIEYEREYILIGVSRNKYDFFIPKFNILIECQGEQHYVPINFSGITDEDKIKERHDELISRDKEKYFDAINNGYKILYYTEPFLFRNKEINVFSNWYSDKKVFIDKKCLLKNIMDEKI